ncbi:homologous-pairing protein 2 homolog isoform X2 [Rhopilema esculentum]|uniref:homologous-pairing protein 2 homolog isoform X2 n=1 Tax=Rhopilema esculentum TaxID=499914 RepID=UPI0031CEC43D
MSKKKSPDDAVLDYLNKQNRPYSATDIFNNMHKEFGKTAIVKALESLAEKKVIHEKTYGKQKVYAPMQAQYGEYDENELKSMDQEIFELNDELTKLRQKCKSQESVIGNLNNQMTTKDAAERLEELEKECQSMQKRIKKIESEGNGITPEVKEKIYKDNKEYIQHWKKRKRMAMDLLNCILEGYPKTKKQLLEETGVETDEDVAVSLENCSK